MSQKPSNADLPGNSKRGHLALQAAARLGAPSSSRPGLNVRLLHDLIWATPVGS